MRGRRFVQGGRATVRGVRYTAARVATRRNMIMREFSLRVVFDGTPKALALVARLRRLLTVLTSMMRTNATGIAKAAAELLAAA